MSEAYQPDHAAGYGHAVTAPATPRPSDRYVTTLSPEAKRLAGRVLALARTIDAINSPAVTLAMIVRADGARIELAGLLNQLARERGGR